MEHYYDLNNAIKAKCKDYHYLCYKLYDKAVHELSKGKKVTICHGNDQLVSVTNHEDFYYFVNVIISGNCDQSWLSE